LRREAFRFRLDSTKRHGRLRGEASMIVKILLGAV
jgi:hypothetical protein